MTNERRNQLHAEHDKAFKRSAIAALGVLIAVGFLGGDYYELAFIIGGISFISLGYTMGQEQVIGDVLGWNDE